MKTSNTIVKNHKARFSFHFSKSDRLQAGLELQGWEIKSIRDGRVQLVDSYVSIRNGEAFLQGVVIAPMPNATGLESLDDRRPRKLLLHRQEIDRMMDQIDQKGKTIVCDNLHWASGKIKASVAVATGKNSRDKRADVKERDNKKAMSRVMKGDYS